MIKVNELSKKYNAENVIDDLSFTLESGTIYGLIGSNGSGKTTLIKCLTGIYRPDKGEVTLDNNLIYENRNAKREIAYIEDTPLHINHFTVTRMGLYYGSFYDDFSHERFLELADELSLNPKAHISNMSLGQKKKLSFALAFARNAKYIILDEPENGLDNESRLVVRKLIQDAADNGASVLISSHDLTNIEDMCDTIIMIDKGKIIYTDSIDDILENASKWLIKATDASDLDAYVLQQEDDVMTVVLLRDRVSAREYLLSKNTTIIDSLKVELIDTYMALKEVGNNE